MKDLVKPIERYRTNFREEIYHTAYCMPEDVDKIEQQLRDALKLLIEVRLSKPDGSMSNVYLEAAIENIAKMSWEDIMEKING